jgi:Ca2+-binding EF-hand superfamily protein
MDFAQGRSSETGATGQPGDDLFSKVDADGNGSIDESELATLMQKMSGSGDAQASDAPNSTDDSTKLFAKLDTDGDGALTQAEFDAGRPGAEGGPQAAGGMPPPPPGGAGGASNAETYDALDTNEDGIVSAAELAAGEAAGATSSTVDTLNALFDAIDTDGDHKLSSDETDAFAQQVAAALQTMQSGTSSSSDSSTASNEEKKPFDLQTLAQLVLKQYQEIAKNQSATASTGTLVDASA